MNPLLSYINLGTDSLTDHKKIETVRLFNALAMSGLLIHLTIFIIYIFLDIQKLGILNLVFVAWFLLIPYFNYRGMIRTAVLWGNMVFTPMVLALGITYSGAQYIEDLLFIGLALTFFSYKKPRPLIAFSVSNILTYIFIVAARYNQWFPPMDEEVATRIPVFQSINVAAILSSMTAILYAINRHYRRLESDLKANAKELRIKTILAEQSLNEARKANASKLKLIKVISHDLRGPFTGLLGLTELMEKQYDHYSKEEMQEMLRMLSDSSKNTLTLIENLVQWAKLQADGIKMERKNIRIASMIKQNFQIYANMAAQKQISLVNKVDEFLLVNADENMLLLIIRNLINNAIKFTPEGGEIRIEAGSKRRYVRIDITDTGIGMSPEQINNFLYDDDNTSASGTLGEKGSGLGLMLCKEFIEKHNCRMYINSNKNRGTVVTFTMPAAKPEGNPDSTNNL